MSSANDITPIAIAHGEVDEGFDAFLEFLRTPSSPAFDSASGSQTSDDVGGLSAAETIDAAPDGEESHDGGGIFPGLAANRGIGQLIKNPGMLKVTGKKANTSEKEDTLRDLASTDNHRATVKEKAENIVSSLNDIHIEGSGSRSSSACSGAGSGSGSSNAFDSSYSCVEFPLKPAAASDKLRARDDMMKQKYVANGASIIDVKSEVVVSNEHNLVPSTKPNPALSDSSNIQKKSATVNELTSMEQPLPITSNNPFRDLLQLRGKNCRMKLDIVMAMRKEKEYIPPHC